MTLESVIIKRCESIIERSHGKQGTVGKVRRLVGGPIKPPISKVARNELLAKAHRAEMLNAIGWKEKGREAYHLAMGIQHVMRFAIGAFRRPQYAKHL